MVSRRDVLKGAISAIAMGSAAGVGAESTNLPSKRDVRDGTGRHPNVLIFLPDQQNGATALPGSPVVKPNVDRFLGEGIAFTAAHCPAPHCCPSRASLMSGLYPSEHGVFNNVDTSGAIHPNPYPGTPYWGQWLRNAGYSTAYAGKLHVGRDVTPENCGFENVSKLEQFRLEDSEIGENAQWEEGRKEFRPTQLRDPGEVFRPNWGNYNLYKTLPDHGSDGYEHLADYRIVQDGIAAMNRLASRRQPWCLAISNSGAHDPYNVPKRFVDMYDAASISLPASFRDTMDDKPRVYQRMRYQHWSQLSDQECRDALRHYYAKCSMQDDLFGMILQALDASGQRDNTIVIYVSDHGDYCAAHGLWMKGVPAFREAYHLPAIVRWPKGIHAPGRQVDAFVDMVDWAPTILEACGVVPQARLSGRSLMPWIRGETPADWRTYTCTQMNGVEMYYTQRIVMTKDWKYVYNGFDYDEMYDLKNDPYEMKNLAFPDLAERSQVVQSGSGIRSAADALWPKLSAPLEEVRRGLLTDMWTFAAAHADTIYSSYGTVAFAPRGPGLGPEPHPGLEGH